MELRFQDWFTDLLGFQALNQFGAQQVQLQNAPATHVDCSQLLGSSPRGFESTSLAVIRNNFAVAPVDWVSGGVINPWYKVESDSTLAQCLTTIQEASFIAFHDDFVSLIGVTAKLETIHDFSGIDAQHVHEAPVYIADSNELVFADTSVVGWLWALDVGSRQIRQINTLPPLENVNGATIRDSRMYLTTNGGRAPAIWNCSLPKQKTWNINTDGPRENVACQLVVNNYHLRHLNSPNDLIFTSTGNILFTDPTYGWAQSWPGVGPPELPTATYHFNTTTGALVALDNDQVLQPNGLALSSDEKTLYLADSNSTSGKPIGVWEHSVRNVYAFDFEETTLTLRNRRLVRVVESGWPDGLRVMTFTKAGEERQLVLVACMGGVDVVDVTTGGAGILLGKWNVGDDIVFNLERASSEVGLDKKGQTWLLTGRKGVYKVTIHPQW